MKIEEVVERAKVLAETCPKENGPRTLYHYSEKDLKIYYYDYRNSPSKKPYSYSQDLGIHHKNTCKVSWNDDDHNRALLFCQNIDFLSNLKNLSHELILKKILG